MHMLLNSSTVNFILRTRSQQLEKMDGSIRRIESKLAKVLELTELMRYKADRLRRIYE